TVSLTAPANGAFVNTATPTVSFTLGETNQGTSYCVIDSGSPVVCTSGSALSSLTQTSHTLQVTHTDLAGNVGSSTTITFTVDTTAPVAPAITVPATSPFYSNTTTPTVSGTA